jgi:hypothetical protein
MLSVVCRLKIKIVYLSPMGYEKPVGGHLYGD